MERDQSYDLLAQQDWERVSLSLTRYTLWKVTRLTWGCGTDRLPKGHTPESIAQEAIRKLFDPDGRSWDPQQQPDLLHHLKNIVDSDVSHMVTSTEQRVRCPWPEEDELVQQNIDHSKNPEEMLLQKEEQEGEERVVSALRDFLADDPELVGLCDCFETGFDKPAEIARQLGKDVEEVYQLKRRLQRKIKTFNRI